jgi:hypothetical protein
MALLPNVPSREAYRAVFRDDSVWVPAMRVIAARHRLAGAAL